MGNRERETKKSIRCRFFGACIGLGHASKGEISCGFVCRTICDRGVSVSRVEQVLRGHKAPRRGDEKKCASPRPHSPKLGAAFPFRSSLLRRPSVFVSLFLAYAVPTSPCHSHIHSTHNKDTRAFQSAVLGHMGSPVRLSCQDEISAQPVGHMVPPPLNFLGAKLCSPRQKSGKMSDKLVCIRKARFCCGP